MGRLSILLKTLSAILSPVGITSACRLVLLNTVFKPDYLCHLMNGGWKNGSSAISKHYPALLRRTEKN
jgi:hypothetical protein